MFSTTIAIPAFLLLTFIYLLFGFLRPNQSKDAQKRPPGPPTLPVIGNLHLLGALPHRNLQSLAIKYGPIMSLRLGRVPTIVVSSAETAQLFLRTHDTVFPSRPKNQAADYIFFDGKGLAFTYGSFWRNIRKLCTIHLLSASKVELFSPLRREELQLMVKCLEKAAAKGESVDLSERVHGLLEDIVYKMILGRNKDDKFDLKGLVKKGLAMAGAFNIADYVPWLGAFDLQGFTRSLKETRKALDEVLEKIIKEHEEVPNVKGRQHRDFIDILLSRMHEPVDDEQNLVIDRDNIKAIAFEMITGSYDPSAVAIEWAMSELLRNPKVMKTLQDELETVVGMNRMVEETDLAKLNYLNMVVKETLRLHPAGAFIPRESTEDVKVDGYYIKKKTRILINVWAIGRNPKVWSDNVDVFYPERFFNSDIDLQGNDSQLIPFGSGRRRCPGMQMGLVTVKLVLAQLVHCFNWELPCGMAPSDLDMTETFGLTIPRSKHLFAVPTHRILKA